jgi:hypothetical protein
MPDFVIKTRIAIHATFSIRLLIMQATQATSSRYQWRLVGNSYVCICPV